MFMSHYNNDGFLSLSQFLKSHISETLEAISLKFGISLAWPDRYFSAGAYRLEIISARAEKGLVQFV